MALDPPEGDENPGTGTERFDSAIRLGLDRF